MLPKNLLLFLFTMPLLASCTFLKTSSVSSHKEKPTDSIADNKTIAIYNDSVDAILLNPNRIRLYTMKGFVTDTVSEEAKTDSIFNYPIQQKTGIASSTMQRILLFIIGDHALYKKNYAPIRQPFHPNLTLEFAKGKKRIYYFISFGTNEVAIADENGSFRFFLFKDTRLLARWASLLFPNDSYYQNLIK